MQLYEMRVKTRLGNFLIEHNKERVIYSCKIASEDGFYEAYHQWPELREKLLYYSLGNKIVFNEKIEIGNRPKFTSEVMKYLNEMTSFGDVLTYGQVAAAVGNNKAARAVGTVMKNNHIFLFVP